jgi:hypothetical protein
MLYDAQIWSPYPFVGNPDPLLLGCKCKEDCLTASHSKFYYGKGYVSSKIASLKGKGNRPEGPEGGRDIAQLFIDLGARRGGWSAPRPDRFTPGKDPVPIVQEAV